MIINFEEKYKKEIVPMLIKEFNGRNLLALPKIDKIIINVGAGRTLTDSTFIDVVLDTLRRITGQEPVKTFAKKSISNFKIREGMAIGAKVTLRGKRMYDFLTKLINITLPRVRDFRGISMKTIDQQGNINIGFKEHVAFPEIHPDEVEKVHGMEVTIVTNTEDRNEAIKLYEALGFPFKKE